MTTVHHDHENPEGNVWRHDHEGGGDKHDHKPEDIERSTGKAADTPDEPPLDTGAMPAPAGYDELGQPLATEQERKEARGGAASRELAESIGDDASGSLPTTSDGGVGTDEAFVAENRQTRVVEKAWDEQEEAEKRAKDAEAAAEKEAKARDKAAKRDKN